MRRPDMDAFDPTYPLLPIACIIGAAMMVLVLMTSFVRQSWNLGVAFLCFWLLMDLTFGAAGLIIWSNNGDIRLHVFCDIGTGAPDLHDMVLTLAHPSLSPTTHVIRCQAYGHPYHNKTAVFNRAPSVCGAPKRYCGKKLYLQCLSI